MSPDDLVKGARVWAPYDVDSATVVRRYVHRGEPRVELRWSTGQRTNHHLETALRRLEPMRKVTNRP